MARAIKSEGENVFPVFLREQKNNGQWLNVRGGKGGVTVE